MRQVIDREKLLDALGLEADATLQLLNGNGQSKPVVAAARTARAQAWHLVFNLVAKFPAEEVE